MKKFLKLVNNNNGNYTIYHGKYILCKLLNTDNNLEIDFTECSSKTPMYVPDLFRELASIIESLPENPI